MPGSKYVAVVGCRPSLNILRHDDSKVGIDFLEGAGISLERL